KVLLSGILSDTVLLKSPTTTEVDRETVAELAQLAGVDAMEFGMTMFAKAGSLVSREAREVLAADFKIYNELSVNVGIGQVETLTLEDLEEVREPLLRSLENLREEKNLDWVMLLVTNVITEESMLLSSSFPKGEGSLIYKRLGDHLFFLPGVLSRKKQLLPEVLRVLEEIA
ncbi:MAG: inorganic diphosphatase, partial [Spirochaetales bacterium]